MQLRTAEVLDLGGSGLPEVPVEPLARLELLTVDEQRARTGARVEVLVEVLEQLEPPVHDRCRAVRILPLEAGDVVVDELGGRRVVAHDDEAGRHLDAGVLP